jgi:LysR family transcriptional regulator, hydrogen peroxide-inducible genes activator
VAMLALPVDEPDLETARLFDDPFLLAVPADDARPSDDKVDASAIDQDRLILLEEGHCLRDQALAYCSGTRGDAQLGATSLSTVMQMVANGYGITLLPRVAVDVEVRGRRVKLLEFAEPAPGRTVGLAWRRTSPRKTDFVALRQLISEMMSEAERKPRPSGRLQRSSLRKREPSTGFPLTRE